LIFDTFSSSFHMPFSLMPRQAFTIIDIFAITLITA
jgi:hypothetical protein